MKYNKAEGNEFFILCLTVFLIFLLVACTVTFLLDIDGNKGIVPLIFIILAVYSFLQLINYLFFINVKENTFNTIATFKPQYLIFFFLNLFLFILSSFVLWQ